MLTDRRDSSHPRDQGREGQSRGLTGAGCEPGCRTSCQVHKDLPPLTPEPSLLPAWSLVPFRSHPMGWRDRSSKRAIPSSTFPKHCMYSLLFSHCLLILGEVFPTLPH